MDTPLFNERGDICANRHKGNSASVEANTRVNKETDTAIILEIFKRKYRTHSKEIGGILNRAINTFSGRLTYLKANGYIKERDDLPKREGCGVLEWTGKQ